LLQRTAWLDSRWWIRAPVSNSERISANGGFRQTATKRLSKLRLGLYRRIRVWW
jgi:hypothetical protein